MPPKRPDPNAGRDISFTRRDFSAEERNFFLYRTVFILANIGIPEIDDITNPKKDVLLHKSGSISDADVNKMIWMVCNFAEYLERSRNKEEFIGELDTAYKTYLAEQSPPNIAVIAKSIATLLARVFVAIQMRVNLGSGGGAGAAAAALTKEVEATAAAKAELTKEVEATAAALTKKVAEAQVHAEVPAEAVAAAVAAAAVQEGEAAGKAAGNALVQSIVKEAVMTQTGGVPARELSARVQKMNAKIAEAAAAREEKKKKQQQKKQQKETTN